MAGYLVNNTFWSGAGLLCEMKAFSSKIPIAAITLYSTLVFVPKPTAGIIMTDTPRNPGIPQIDQSINTSCSERNSDGTLVNIDVALPVF